MKATKDSFVFKVCVEGSIMINQNIGKEFSLNNGDCIEVVKRFSYLGDMLNCGGGLSRLH